MGLFGKFYFRRFILDFSQISIGQRSHLEIRVCCLYLKDIIIRLRIFTIYGTANIKSGKILSQILVMYQSVI